MIPICQEDETPTQFAERTGKLYAGFTSCDHKKEFGQYLTPLSVAQFMAQLSEVDGPELICILDPGAGAGILSCSLLEELSKRKKIKKVFLEAYEVDELLANCLECVLAYAKEWLQKNGICLEYSINRTDFILSNAFVLNKSLNLFELQASKKHEFDIIISNPPYFKIPITDSRAIAAASVVYGQPNLYAIFMAVSSFLLRESGELIFITPRSYTAGQYFQLFREQFFELMLPKKIHLFESRKDAFNKDDVLQENVVLYAKRMHRWSRKKTNCLVQITASSGVGDLSDRTQRLVPVEDVLESRFKGKILRIPTAESHDEIRKVVHSWSGCLGKYGLQISTGPIVPFRVRNLLFKRGNVPEKHAPLLWMQNVTAMNIDWPKKNVIKPQYVLDDESSRSILLLNKNYILLRRFSSKEQDKRLIAAPYIYKKFQSTYIGLENHLNYIYRPNGQLCEEEAYGLAALLNSSLLDEYFRTFNGNTQVSATELRSMPLPSWELITYLGKKILLEQVKLDDLDALIAEVLNHEASFNMKVIGVVNA